jgi:hypothetical protein
MKTFTSLLALFLTLTTFAQQMVTKDVGDFKELKVYDLMVVNLIQSDENKVVITGDYAQDVDITNDNGKLKLRMNVEKSFRGEDTFIEVYFKNIATIDANEGAYIVGNAMIDQTEIELRAQEGATIKVGLEVENVVVKSVTGGIIKASGLAKYQDIKINTGGIFEGRELQTQRTKIRITAAGEAEINASDKVDVRVTAGGDVDIYGNPTEVDQKRVAGGRIKIMN